LNPLAANVPRQPNIGGKTVPEVPKL
jgi:hypothetical protein